MNKKIKEGLEMDMTTYKKVKGTLDPKTPVKITGDKPSPTMTTLSEDDILEPEAVITPQDNATIKYLSNVKDSKTGKISEPFTIGAQKYQMVRGTTPSKEIVMAVFCHDETDENGENIIHSMEDFEKNIANPMKEQMGMMNQDNQPKIIDAPTPDQLSIKPSGDNNLGLGVYKFFLVDTNTGKFRKFKNVGEIAAATMTENEKFMTLKEFQNFFKNKVFGKNRKVSEIAELPKKPDVDKAIEQMVMKMKSYMNKINEPIEQVEFITKLVDMMHFDKSKLPILISQLKNATSKSFDQQPASDTDITEKKIISKKQLEESLSMSKVIKTIKKKDIK